MGTPLALRSFDRPDLSRDDVRFLAAQASEIRQRLGQTAQAIFEIGERLLAVKERLGHGRFGDWLAREFDWSADTANRMMNVAANLKNRNVRDLPVDTSALYVLASPKTPDDVRDRFIAKASRGERVTHSEVKAAVERARAADRPEEPALADEAAEDGQPSGARLHRAQTTNGNGNGSTYAQQETLFQQAIAELRDWRRRYEPHRFPKLNVVFGAIAVVDQELLRPVQRGRP